MYSIDKVKLYIWGIKLPLIQEIIDNFAIDNMVTGYESHKITSCRYNYTIKNNSAKVFGMKMQSGTIYLGIEPNWSKDKNKGFRDLIVEYNPNKVNISDFKQMKFLQHIKIDRIEIKSMDIALDIPADISDFVVHKRHGSEYKAMIEHNKLETIYLGAFGTNGHIKIYDKAKEQKEHLIKWTRFEITYKNLGFMDIRDEQVILDTKLPKILIINKNVDLEELKGTDKFLILTSMENMNLLHLLDKRKARKIKEYHSKYLQEFDINKEEFIKVYKEFEIL